ncbi:MAG TPA: alpha/beta fold hydrolase [Ktedonobacterales bacterium]|nr:alpha/beta fold hydrolase [Ktedonobacterales bacterium]
MSQGFVTVNGARLWYEDTGSGPAVTLVHAGVTDHRQWDEQVPALAEHYRVIRFDMRGYGQSETKPGKASLSEDIGGMLDALGVERTALMGCSMGGAAAIDFTVTHPERVGALITVGSGLSGAEHVMTPEEEALFKEAIEAQNAGDAARLNELEARVWCDGFARAAPDVKPSVRQRFLEMNTNNNRRFFAGEWEGVEFTPLDPPAIGRLGTLAIPTLVIVGSGDVSEVRATADDIANGIPGARKVMMEGLGHVPNMDEPEEFNRIILEFLRSVW